MKTFNDFINEGYIRAEPWEITMKGYDNNSRAGRAIGTSLNAANKTGVRSLKPSTAANMERQARKLEGTNAEGANKGKAIRAVSRLLTKLTKNQRRANWFANRQEMA